MRLLVFAAALLVTARAASLGSNKCTWGPSYWCSSVPAAAACSAFDHCLDSQWTRQLQDVQQTDLCTFSQKMVETVRQVIKKDNGKDHAAHLLASTCSYVTNKMERKQCKLLVTKYTPQVFRLIQTDMEPQSVAAVLGFCQEPKDNSETPVAYAPPTNDTICDDCWAFVGDLRTLINQPGSKDQFVKVMEDICSDFGPLDVFCKEYVDQVMPDLFDFIKENDNPETACRAGTFCLNKVDKPKRNSLFKKTARKWQKSMEQLQLQVAQSGEVVPCNVCRKTLTPVLTFEKESYFRESVEKAFAFICSLTNVGEQKCHALSDILPQELATLMTRNMDAGKICAETLRCIEEDSVVVPVPAVSAADPAQFCSDCEKFFADVRAILRDNNSAPEAIALAKQSICQGVGSMEYECNDILEAFTPVVFKILAREDNPARVCAALTLCPKRADLPKFDIVKEFNAAWEEKSLGDFKCDECATIVQDVRDMDRNPDVQNSIETFLNKVCAELGSEAQKCKDLVTQYSPQLFEIIASELDPEVVCEILLHCTKPEHAPQEEEDIPAATLAPPEAMVLAVQPTEPTPRFEKKSKKNSAAYKGFQRSNEAKVESTEVKIESTEAKVGESVKCAICKLAMETLDSRIAENRTEENVIQALEGLCNLLPTTVKQPCDQFIEEFTPALIDLLLQELDPLVICDELQICDNGTKAHYSYTAPGAEPRQMTKTPEVVEEWQEVKQPGATLQCQICELVVGSIDSIIGQNRSEAAIQQAIDDICNILPSGIRSQCLSFVNEYASVVIQLILEELDPNAVCVKIGLCDNVTTPQEVQPEVTWCDVCKLVMGAIDDLLGSNRSEPAVENALEKVCNMFPDTIRSECVIFVSTYAPDIINLLVQELDPSDVCRTLKLCPREEETPVQITPKPKAQPLCDICKLVLQQVDIVLGDNRTEPEVERALDKACTYFPETIQAECQSFVNAYAPAVINLLIQEIKPSEVCKKLGLCKEEATVQTHLPHTIEEAPADDLECAVCHAIIAEINNIIGEDRSEQAIIKAVEVVCDFLSGDLKLQCKSEVENYGPAVLDLLQHMDDPKAVCRVLKACSEAEVEPQPQSPPGESETCIICRTLATYAGEALNDQVTEQEIVKLLEDVCSVLPGNLMNQCVVLVEQFAPMLIELLAEKDDPLQVCRALKLCASENSSQQPHLVGVDSCTFGPAYWCANIDHARQCQAVEHCVEHYGMKP